MSHMNREKRAHRPTWIVTVAITLFTVAIGTDIAVAQPPLPPYVAGQQGPAGGYGGHRCRVSDLPAAWTLRAVNVRAKALIDAIELKFDTPGRPEPTTITCGGDGGEWAEPLRLDPDESIVRVLGRYTVGASGGSMFVAYLFIQTTKGKMREYGDPANGSIYFDYIAPKGTGVAGFVVYSGTYVDRLGVVLRKRS